jgi:hypothetical protein
MLEIRALMNSPVEEIFAFKTCCGVRAFDQNLEIHVTNRSDRMVEVPSYFDLTGDSGSERVDTLMPHGKQRIMPGETVGFYCLMDESRWKAARQMVFYDTEGNSYTADIAHPQGEKN